MDVFKSWSLNIICLQVDYTFGHFNIKYIFLREFSALESEWREFADGIQKWLQSSKYWFVIKNQTTGSKAFLSETTGI